MRAIVLLLCVLFAAQVTAQVLTSGGKLKPEQAIMDIRHYTITLDIDTGQQRISGNTVVDMVFNQPSPVVVLDLMNNLQVEKVWVNNKPGTFTHNNGILTITPATQLPAGKASVKVQYAGSPHVAVRPPWEDGFTWARDSLGNPWITITAEGGGGKIYYPCKDHPSDEPNEGAELIITVPGNLVVAGPGLLTKVKKQKGKATYHWKTTYTINNYNILFNVADYVVEKRTYTTVSGKKVPMEFYVLSYHKPYAAHHLDLLEKMVRVQEKYFGEYPWVKEKIAIAETSHLGMEHQTMNAYGNKFRYTRVGGEDFDWLMHHELGHEWWGNKVTGADWADMWIQEGICSYGDALYIREKEGEFAYNDHFRQQGFYIRHELPVVQGKDIDAEKAYIGDIYSKGAYFMHTLRFVIGDSIFFPALKRLATDPATTYNNMITTETVQDHFSKACGYSLEPLFTLFLRTTRKLECRVVAKPGNEYAISITNIDMPLPAQVVTDMGTQKLTLGKEPVIIKSTTVPQVDPEGFYMKRVILE